MSQVDDLVGIELSKRNNISCVDIKIKVVKSSSKKKCTIQNNEG